MLGIKTLGKFRNAIRDDDTLTVSRFLASGKQKFKGSLDKDGYTAVHYAAMYNSCRTLTLLAQLGFPLNSRTPHGHTPMHIAARHGGTARDRDNVLHHLHRLGAPDAVDTLDKYGISPLFSAIDALKFDNVKYLVDAGAQLDNGRCLVTEALEEKRPDIALYLLDTGADPLNENLRHHNKSTALHAAALHGFLDIVRRLLDAGADIDARNAYGRTPLHLAAQEGAGPVVEYLVERGADARAIDNNGHTPDILARAYSKHDTAYLIEKALHLNAEKKRAAAAPASDGWIRMGEDRIAFVETCGDAGRRLTEVFNFNTCERFIISENLTTQAEAISTPDKFRDLDTAVIRRAADAYCAQGGTLDAEKVFHGHLVK